jgi:hypothetical protein
MLPSPVPRAAGYLALLLRLSGAIRRKCDVIGACRSDFFSGAVAKSETSRDCIKLEDKGVKK